MPLLGAMGNCWVPFLGAMFGAVPCEKVVTFSTLIWIDSRICLPLLDTGSYIAITLKAQKLAYALWGLRWNHFLTFFNQ